MASKKEQLAVFERGKELDPRDIGASAFLQGFDSPQAVLGAIKDERERKQTEHFLQSEIDPRDSTASEFLQEFSLSGLPEHVAKQKIHFTGSWPDLKKDQTAADFLQWEEE